MSPIILISLLTILREGVEKRVSQEEKPLITTIYGDFRYKISKIAMKFRLYKHPLITLFTKRGKVLY